MQTSFNMPSNSSLYYLAVLSVLAIALASESGGAPDSHCMVKSYEGTYSYDPTSTNGPEHWGSILGEHYETCGHGHRQSPIDFPNQVVYAPLSAGPQVSMSYANMTPSSGSYNWALNCDHCEITTFRGKEYKLINLHFHSPSEHRLNGTAYPLEAHMVHIAEDGSLAVIATMFEYIERSYAARVAHAGSVEYGASSILKHAFKSVSKGSDLIPLGSILDPKKGFCSYVGSLTTPPCTEGVTWFMSENIVSVSKRQVARFRLTAGLGLDGNNRPVQPIEGREVTCFIKWDVYITSLVVFHSYGFAHNLSSL